LQSRLSVLVQRGGLLPYGLCQTRIGIRESHHSATLVMRAGTKNIPRHPHLAFESQFCVLDGVVASGILPRADEVLLDQLGHIIGDEDL
jgi:hypothetical protein